MLVLSDKGWDRRFKRDPNVLGRTVLVNGAPFEIVGVMPAGFRGLAGGRARLLGAAVAARAVPSRAIAAARTASAWRSSAG